MNQSVKKKTVAESVAEALRRDIHTGKADLDRPLLSERELAERFKIARGTARRSLQLLCREGLLVADKRRGYFPASPAETPGNLNHRHSVIYYYADDEGAPILNTLGAQILNGANAESHRMGINLFALSRSPVDFAHALGNGWREDLRGVMLGVAAGSLLARLRGLKIPFVLVETDLENEPVTTVIQDNAGGTEQALAHMLERGHRRLGIIVSEQDTIHSRQRREAYRAFLVRNDLPRRRHWIGAVPQRGGAAGLAALLDGGDPPTGVYVAGGGLVPGVLEEMKRRGLRCPEDLSLTAWGDPGLEELRPDPPVTNVRWSREAMGRIAMRALEDVVRNAAQERTVIKVPARLNDCGAVAKIEELSGVL